MHSIHLPGAHGVLKKKRENMFWGGKTVFRTLEFGEITHASSNFQWVLSNLFCAFVFGCFVSPAIILVSFLSLTPTIKEELLDQPYWALYAILGLMLLWWSPNNGDYHLMVIIFKCDHANLFYAILCLLLPSPPCLLLLSSLGSLKPNKSSNLYSIPAKWWYCWF